MKSSWLVPHAKFAHNDNTPKSQGDQRLPHDSGRDLSIEDLKAIGVLYYQIPEVEGVNELARERGYRNRDEIIVSPASMGAVYEEKVKTFFAEHLHEDEEIRYVRGGQGYFDVRSKDDEWVRVAVEKVSAAVPIARSDSLLLLPENKCLRSGGFLGSVLAPRGLG